MSREKGGNLREANTRGGENTSQISDARMDPAPNDKRLIGTVGRPSEEKKSH